MASSTTTAGLIRARSMRTHTATATGPGSLTPSSSSNFLRRAATISTTVPASSAASVSTSTSSSASTEQKSTSSSTKKGAAKSALNASSSPSQNLKLFLANLRALDLDLHPDWPGITPDIFVGSPLSSPDQKRRVQCVEWALYHLFQLWDPEETRSKLSPLFPPNDQVQSLNLRTTFLRWLDQLKKSGLLSRETLLRKTMLDECKGDRFEEVMATFSAAVLRKVTKIKTKGRHPSIAQTMALEDRGAAGDRPEMAVLMLAYQASVSRQLREKKKARQMFQDLADVLSTKEKTIVQRQEYLNAVYSPHSLPREEKIEMFNLVRNNWAGNEQWMETLLHGDEAAKRDPFFTTPFDRVWRRLHAGRISDLEDKKGGLLEQLDTRIRMQQERLAKWQDFRERLFGTTAEVKPIMAKRISLNKSNKSLDLHFRDHLGLSLVAMSPRRKRLNSISAAPPTLPVDAGEYASFIDDFQNEFASAGKAKQTTPVPSWRTRASPRRSLRGPSFGHEVKEAVEDGKVQETAWERAVERPIKVRRGDDNPLRRSIALRVPSPKPPPKISFPSPKRASDVLHEAVALQKLEPQEPTAQFTLARRPAVRLAAEPQPIEDRTAQMIELAEKATLSPIAITKPKKPLSLAERARLSMMKSPAFHVELEDDDDDSESIPSVTVQEPEPQEDENQAYEDLVSRTRKSMAGFEAAQKKAQVDRQRSLKMQRSESKKNKPHFDDMQDGNSLSVEDNAKYEQRVVELMDADHDYEAVFRSRPRIKSSPAPSPNRMGFTS
ncbi:hypothetical protein TD95_001248 [Thielaviopsis punctulata]|uniref:HAUS augmin-like complex subunit 6 N-terminal domain-containing protein n=1 Tax=Thielaviopsis punctulata TaxID=72032 RepID=A0A0F4ZBM3_9PEZI|nr:hypothetical protein TD95_001248 [Thielaviopsis punctulata]